MLRWSGMLLTSSACCARGIWIMTRQTGKEDKELAWGRISRLILERTGLRWQAKQGNR